MVTECNKKIYPNHYCTGHLDKFPGHWKARKISTKLEEAAGVELASFPRNTESSTESYKCFGKFFYIQVKLLKVIKICHL